MHYLVDAVDLSRSKKGETGRRVMFRVVCAAQIRQPFGRLVSEVTGGGEGEIWRDFASFPKFTASLCCFLVRI